MKKVLAGMLTVSVLLLANEQNMTVDPAKASVAGEPKSQAAQQVGQKAHSGKKVAAKQHKTTKKHAKAKKHSKKVAHKQVATPSAGM